MDILRLAARLKEAESTEKNDHQKIQKNAIERFERREIHEDQVVETIRRLFCVKPYKPPSTLKEDYPDLLRYLANISINQTQDLDSLEGLHIGWNQ
jgi:hypothetical protein